LSMCHTLDPLMEALQFLWLLALLWTRTTHGCVTIPTR
jgi:hypothetical protein